MGTWYTVADPSGETRLVGAWPDAPNSNLETLGMVLDIAREQVIAYAPAPAATDDWANTPPDRFVYAQLQQAVNLWNAGRVNSSGDIGDGAYTFTPRPLDKTIRTIIRPIDGKPDVY